MSKAVLVMEMPENCSKCPLWVDSYGMADLCCGLYKKDREGFFINKEIDIKRADKPDWCPLKKLPEEIHSELHMYEYVYGYDDGWNNCLKKILEE